jgi:hypothetical protein
LAARVFSLIGEAAISTQPSAKRLGELVVGREQGLEARRDEPDVAADE